MALHLTDAATPFPISEIQILFGIFSGNKIPRPNFGRKQAQLDPDRLTTKTGEHGEQRPAKCRAPSFHLAG